ncbi:hypothetical protein M231_07730 [Tremella mesenterica]|uniref:Flavoprotein domain-containing protein n=1 Tax=Tremella mesenterica TaxID=5217 RepID=A0A4Q1BAJ6_TREME|nr:hypothetical protein M231_07730 [Tremella mesenterica]
MSSDAQAGPSRPSGRPFVSADHRPSRPDGIFRVLLITTGSVASIKAPDIVAALAKKPHIDLQVVATNASLHFFNQDQIDKAVYTALYGAHPSSHSAGTDGGRWGSSGTYENDPRRVTVWTDTDEWSDWRKVGDPILHIELRRWADLVVVAPCSADMLAKIANGFADNLALSLLRALSPSTPVVICPAMNTYMYQHKLTAKHLRVLQELDYLVLGPQGTGTLACGDEGPGKMTDWREIVSTIENFAELHHQTISRISNNALPTPPASLASNASQIAGNKRPLTPPTPGRSPRKPASQLPEQDERMELEESVQVLIDNARPLDVGAKSARAGRTGIQDWATMTSPYGGDGSAWNKKFWMG